MMVWVSCGIWKSIESSGDFNSRHADNHNMYLLLIENVISNDIYLVWRREQSSDIVETIESSKS